MIQAAKARLQQRQRQADQGGCTPVDEQRPDAWHEQAGAVYAYGVPRKVQDNFTDPDSRMMNTSAALSSATTRQAAVDEEAR